MGRPPSKEACVATFQGQRHGQRNGRISATSDEGSKRGNENYKKYPVDYAVWVHGRKLGLGLRLIHSFPSRTRKEIRRTSSDMSIMSSIRDGRGRERNSGADHAVCLQRSRLRRG
eukprot:6207743-Pleurochrysis_carterae.AAC.1